MTGSVDEVREQLLAAVRGRIGTGDPSEILAEDAVAEADRLLGFLAIPEGVDAEVMHAVGLFHLSRAKLRSDAGQQDQTLALILLLPIFLSQPDALPDPVRSWISQVGGADLAGAAREPALAEALGQVAGLLLQRLDRLGERDSGAAVVGLARQVVDRLPEGHPARARELYNLGYALMMADHRPGANDAEAGAEVAVVDETVAVFREAFEATPSNDQNHARCAYGLAQALWAKAESSEDNSPLIEAIGLLSTAVHPDTGNSTELSQLGEARAQLGEALARVERALRRTPWESFDDLFSQPGASKADEAESAEDPMSFLAKLLGVGSIDEQGSNTQFADLAAIHPDFFKDFVYLAEFGFRAINNIASESLMRLMGRADRADSDKRPPWLLPVAPTQSGRTPSTDLTDLDEILGLHERALRELPTDTPEYFQLRSSYACLSMARMRGRYDAEAMAQQEEIGQQLPAMMQAASAYLGDRFSTREEMENDAAMGTAMLSPFETMGAVADTIKLHRRRLATMPEDDPGRRATLTYLAHALFTRYLISTEEPIFQEAVGAARQTLTSDSPPDPQLVFLWGLLACLRPASSEMTETSAPASESRSSGAVPNSSLACFKIFDGDASGALVALENHRAIMLSSALDTRRELDNLRAAEPRLAERFVTLRERVYADLQRGRGPGALQREDALIEEWNTVLDQIKTLPGFDRFLLPVPLEFPDLVPAAAQGPVITINLDEWRCDALVLRDGDIQVVSLPRLKVAELVEQAAAFQAAIDALSAQPTGADVLVIGAARRVAIDTLGWLWDVLAEPVLDALGLAERLVADRPWPRLWWSPTGPLNFLPLHAAGHHETAGASVLDRAVSSYTPTLRALLHSRSRRSPPWQRTALAVAMPETPGHAALPATVREATAIATGLAGLTLIGPAATRAAVRSALPGATIAHFACHASSDPTDPSASHLLLHDGPLNVTEISRLRLDSAELGYLSACATARGSTVLPDEAIHLTSALQLAGYAQTIGTLWEVSDHIAARTAADFYRELAQTITDSDRPAGALALHIVTRRMREESPATPWAWATYVHAGA